MIEGLEERQIIVRALQKLKPNAEFSCGDDYSELTWLDKTQDKPTEKEFNDAVTAENAEWDAQDYARKRKAEYDALNQFEMQYDDKKNSTTTWDDAIDAIKAKWPKDNSGPV